ncbi:nucleotidyltransferase family protein, partial [Odoribacter sp. OttesenSCG-928-A06]|nr:nucleotidyltransferase family protein [Odoribacter sp. OttesenSCG-928-A06]
VASRETQRYLLFDSALRLYGWKNEKTGEVKSPYPDFLPDLYHKYAFGGIHVLSHDILPLMKEWEGKFSIIDFYLSIADQKQVCAYPAPQGLVWCDIGKPEALKEAERLLEL